MNDFTASNGVTVSKGPEGHILLPPGVIGIGEDSQQALREYFHAEADKQFGRWRSVKNPVWTAVAQDGSGVILFRHDDGQREFSVESRETQLHRWSPELREVAREYFAAHPEPKPWHDAEIGDVWVMGPLDVAYTVVGGVDSGLWFTRADVFGRVEKRDLADSAFTVGTRIWRGSTA